MGVMLQRDKQSQRLYLHDVVAISKKETTKDGEVTPITTETATLNDSLYMTSILLKAYNVKEKTTYPNAKYSKDDTIFDDFEDEEVMFTADGDIAFDGFGADAQRVDSDAHKEAVLWAQNPDTNVGDQRLASYHFKWYIIEKFDSMLFKYKIVEELTVEEFEKYRKRWEEQYGRNFEEELSGCYNQNDDSYRQAVKYGEERSDINVDDVEHTGENKEIFGLGKSENGKQHNPLNPDGSVISGNENRQRDGAAGLKDDTGGKYSKDDTIFDDFEDEEVMFTAAYAKKQLQHYINENSILYIEPNKKRTNNWLSLNRLQLPVGETQRGSIRRISYSDG